jgi:uncharacterized protein (TIGR02246 family)
MNKNLWSIKSGFSMFALAVVGVVLLDHVFGVEPTRRSERVSAATSSESPSADSEATAIATTESDDSVKTSDLETSVENHSAADETVDVAIRKTADSFVAAFDRGDAAAVADLWTSDGEYIDDLRQRYRGRAEIERAYAQLFATCPGAKIEIKIDAIRPIGADTAIEDGHASLVPHQPGAPASSPYTVVHTKVDGKWLMASVREPVVQSAASSGPLASLDWLVGTWYAEQNGASMEVEYRWVANHAFLERTYSVKKEGLVTASGVQLIGQDANHQEIQSWDFNSDAGYAVGNWIVQPDGWGIVTRGKLAGGEATSAVIYLTRADDNTLGWQSRERTADGGPLPDTDGVWLKREPTGR